jgi:geranylgeranyl diphosphate synthase type I
VDGPDILYRYRSQIENEVARLFPGAGSAMDEMLRYQLGFSENGLPNLGKCLRPSLTLLACESRGGDVKTALPAAIAIELVHNFSLIHDDVEDGDELRHHRPTLWRVYGRDQAISAGVALWAKAHQTMLGALDRGLPPEVVIEARRVVNDACGEMLEGQHLDLSYELRLDVTLPEYIEMISGKSAALISASLQVGAILSGARPEEAAPFAVFGRQLGLAFQIRDDILGIWGEGSATGKPVGADISRKKKTLPIVHALQQASGADRETLRYVYTKPEVDESDVDNVFDILQRWNCRYFAQGLAEDYRSRAMAALSRANISAEARVHFDELTSFILERDY